MLSIENTEHKWKVFFPRHNSLFFFFLRYFCACFIVIDIRNRYKLIMARSAQIDRLLQFIEYFPLLTFRIFPFHFHTKIELSKTH